MASDLTKPLDEAQPEPRAKTFFPDQKVDRDLDKPIPNKEYFLAFTFQGATRQNIVESLALLISQIESGETEGSGDDDDHQETWRLNTYRVR